MYSRSAKGGEKGDPNRNPWLAKMVAVIFLTNRDEMSIHYRGHSKDTSYQMLVHFGKAVSEKIFKKSTNQKQTLPVEVMFF
jgi:hypothetical protein